MALNDAEFEKQRQRIIKLRDRWSDNLGLGRWEITQVFNRDTEQMKDADNSPDPKALAMTRTRWMYLTATVQWNMQHLDEYSDQELERIYVHEMMHILVNEMRPWIVDDEGKADDMAARVSLFAEERVCTQLAQAFLWVKVGDPIEMEYTGC